MVATLAPAGFLAIFFAWPAVALALRGFGVDGRPSLQPFVTVFTSSRTWRALWFTLWSASASTLICVLLGIPGAYILYRHRFRGRAALRAAVTLPFVLPTVVVGVAFGSLLRSDGLLGQLGLEGTAVPIVAALVFFNYSVAVRTIGTMWERLDPRLEQAASTLGASAPRVLCTVTLPALAPALVSSASLIFLFSASSYGIVMVLGQTRFESVETQIWFLTTQLLDLSGAAALSIVQLVIVTTALWISSRTQGRLTRALTMPPQTQARLSLRASRDALPLLVTLGVGVILIGLPMANLGWRSLHRGGEFGLANYRQIVTEGALGISLWRALRTSLLTALAATAIAVPLGLLVALVASRRPRPEPGRRALAGLEALFLLPLGVSAVTVGFGYLITLNRPPFDLRSSPALIPIAQAVVALPLVVRSLLPVLRAIDSKQLEAAATLGSAPWAVLARVELPHLRRGMGLALGFAFATSLGEFGATSFLARPDNPTLPVLIFRLFSRPGSQAYGLALAASVLLALLAGATMAAAEGLLPERRKSERAKTPGSIGAAGSTQLGSDAEGFA